MSGSGTTVDPRALRQRHSWDANADAWTRAVRERRIASRRAGTDDAIVAATVATGARRVLDLGCGEGWLCRALAARGIEAVGIDASSALVESARALGGARYACVDYATLADAPLARGGFDAVVFNFALLDEDVLTPLGAALACVGPRGRLLVQTLHPSAAGDDVASDGWRCESFATFGDDFSAEMPWYFRTSASWTDALVAAGWRPEAPFEPLDPATGAPLSLLFVAHARAD